MADVPQAPKTGPRPCVCETGVGVSGVQRSDAGAGGGREFYHEAAGRRLRCDGERLQTDVQQQAAAVFRVKPLRL